MIDIQFQDKTGVWRTCGSTLNNSQRILSAMQTAAKSHPGLRIRAITKDGRMVDMLIN